MNDHKYLSITNLNTAIEEINDLRVKLTVQNRVVTAFLSKQTNEDLVKSIEKHGAHNFFPDPKMEQQIDNMCFIRLYSSFEAFMCNLLIDLYYMFPEGITSNRKINVETILLWNNTKSVKEYVIDSIAIDNSYTLEIWKNTLKNTFGIDLEATPNLFEQLQFLDSIRNLTLHSDGRINSKFISNAPKWLTDTYIKDGEFERVELSFNYNECFLNLHVNLLIMIEIFEEKYQFAKKNLN